MKLVKGGRKTEPEKIAWKTPEQMEKDLSKRSGSVQKPRVQLKVLRKRR